jgi:predicted transcriptional regulator
MTQVRDQVIELIKSLPEDATLEDIHYHLYVRKKVEHGLKAIDEGRFVSQEEAEKRVEGWLKSSKGSTGRVLN